MLWFVFLMCVLASGFNAASSLAEREASRKPDIGKLFSRQFSYILIRDREFLVGLLFQVFASIFEIIALKQGSLVIIGPMLTLDIVFLWVFISYRYKLRIEPKNWIAVALVMIGISIVFISAQPRSGRLNYSAFAWVWVIGGVILLCLAAYIVSMSDLSPKFKAAFLGLATASNYALDAGLVKLVFNDLKTQGWDHMFTNWPIYTLIVFAVLSIIMTQNTFGAGPIAISQPVIEATQAVASVLIGTLVFHDVIKHSFLNFLGLCTGLIIACLGITLMATTKKLFDRGST